MKRVEHTLEPIYDENSTTLILGSMPSEVSRNLGKYYAHKSNRFWSVLSAVYDEEIGDWKEFILRHRLALWDVIAVCDIEASSDASIRRVETNDIASLVRKTKIRNIVVLGKSAYNLYNKYIKEDTGIEAIYLPSTSMANASYSFEHLVEEYRIIRRLDV